MLDNSENMQGKFKLIRIQNKLDESEQKVVVNYLFMSKVQCELQLSIVGRAGKEIKHYSINHFLEGLTRGKFGPISTAAFKVSMFDPMIVSYKDELYAEKKRNSLLKEEPLLVHQEKST
jgi:hypothetical protein